METTLETPTTTEELAEVCDAEEMQSEEMPRLWTDKDLSHYFGVGPTTIWRLRQKDLPYVYILSEVRYIPESIMAWAKAHEVNALSE